MYHIIDKQVYKGRLINNTPLDWAQIHENLIRWMTLQQSMNGTQSSTSKENVSEINSKIYRT